MLSFLLLCIGVFSGRKRAVWNPRCGCYTVGRNLAAPLQPQRRRSMSTTQRVGPNHWRVHTGDPAKSTVLVEMWMSEEEVQRLVQVETTRLARANRGRPVPAELTQGAGNAMLMAYVHAIASTPLPSASAPTATATPPPEPPAPPSGGLGRGWLTWGSRAIRILRWLPQLWEIASHMTTQDEMQQSLHGDSAAGER